MSIEIKLCGLVDMRAVETAVAAGVQYFGFVFCQDALHRLTPEQARPLVMHVPSVRQSVGLFVDPTDDELRHAVEKVPLTMIQLHGNETPVRVRDVRKLTGLPVIKALAVTKAEDLQRTMPYEAAADYLLFDTRLGASPAGMGTQRIDWNLFQRHKFGKPWFLSGGINAANLAEAVTVTGARMVDVSSGVEDAPARKNPDKIRAVCAEAKKLK